MEPHKDPEEIRKSSPFPTCHAGPQRLICSVNVLFDIAVLVYSHTGSAHLPLNVNARDFCPGISLRPQKRLCPLTPLPCFILSRSQKAKTPQVVQFHSAMFFLLICSSKFLCFIFYHFCLPFCSEQHLFLLVFCM